jgi:biopolymer transport protein ExbB
MQNGELGLAHFWAAGDAVTHGVAWLLLAMSIASWFVIFWKGVAAIRIRRVGRLAISRFWSAPSLDDAIASLSREDREGVFAPLAEQVRHALRAGSGSGRGSSIGDRVERRELAVRVLRQQMTASSARLEAGLTLLASVGSTAPFIGLFGTVWGIYHALIAIAGTGQVMIDRVAGPVGEALIMTAAGLAVAIPAVLGYNAFTRLNRVTLAELDGFAHDLATLVARQAEGSGVSAAGEDDELDHAIVDAGSAMQPVGR